jgi:hypothetical protein
MKLNPSIKNMSNEYIFFTDQTALTFRICLVNMSRSNTQYVRVCHNQERYRQSPCTVQYASRITRMSEKLPQKHGECRNAATGQATEQFTDSCVLSTGFVPWCGHTGCY